MKPPTPRRRGFTLIEAVFAMFLTFIVLMALTYLLQQISRAKTTIKEGGLMSEIFHASSLIRTDLGASQGNVIPLAGTSSELRMTTLSPDSSYVFDVDNPGNLDDRYISTLVRYNHDGTNLRRIRSGGFTGNDALLPLKSFQVRRDGGELTADFEVENERRARTYNIVFRVKP